MNTILEVIKKPLAGIADVFSIFLMVIMGLPLMLAHIYIVWKESKRK